MDSSVGNLWFHIYLNHEVIPHGLNPGVILEPLLIQGRSAFGVSIAHVIFRIGLCHMAVSANNDIPNGLMFGFTLCIQFNCFA